MQFADFGKTYLQNRDVKDLNNTPVMQNPAVVGSDQVGKAHRAWDCPVLAGQEQPERCFVPLWLSIGQLCYLK